MTIKTNLCKTIDSSYDIVVERGVLSRANELLKLDRRVMIITDSGIPKEYSSRLALLCKSPYIYTVPSGEESKSFTFAEKICAAMLENKFTRKDCVVAIGGGVCGDLAGFCASIYMRGIDFYNIPTTLLSQVDSSIGGKTAVNLGETKNIVGAFYQPKKVLIDPELLKTLPPRQISNGLSEAVKMAICFDADFFEFFEKEKIDDSNLEKVIIGSLKIKKAVVEEDETEQGLRKVLNFGHTIGHGIESATGMKEFYHGECVALGMLPMCASDVRERLKAVLQKLGLPTEYKCDTAAIYNALTHDKKSDSDGVSAVFVNNVGSFEIKKVTFDSLNDIIRKEYSK